MLKSQRKLKIFHQQKKMFAHIDNNLAADLMKISIFKMYVRMAKKEIIEIFAGHILTRGVNSLANGTKNLMEQSGSSTSNQKLYVLILQ